MKQLILSLLAMASVAYCSAQSVKMYQSRRGLFTQVQLDSIIAGMQQRANDLGQQMKVSANPKELRRNGDTIFYTFNIMVGNMDLKAKEDKYLGTPFPDFSFVDLTKQKTTMADLKGKPTVINFWYTTCPPCVAEIPGLNDLKKTYPDVNFVAITYENDSVVKDFIKSQPFDFRHIAGATELTDKLQLGYPTTFFMDKDGIIRHLVIGGKTEGIDKEKFNAGLAKIRPQP